MSAISSMTSGAQYALLQQLQQRGASGSVNRAGFQAQRKTDFGAALQAAGVDSSKIDGIQQQIDSAIQQARQNGGSGTSDRAAVKSAIDTVLKNNGVDVTKFDQAMKAQHAKHSHGGKRAGGDGDGDADDGGAGVNESSEANQTGATSNQSAALLQSLLSGATTQAQVGGLPAGSLLDVAA